MATIKTPLALVSRIRPLRPISLHGRRAILSHVRDASTTSKRSTSTHGPASTFDVPVLGGTEFYPSGCSAGPSKKAPTRNHALERMPTSSLLRSLFLGSIFTSPSLLKMTMPLFDRIANSKSIFYSPDRNRIVRYLTRNLVYDAFCAGVNEEEVLGSRQTIRKMGFAGVVLCLGREVQISKDNKLHSTASGNSAGSEVSQWRDGYLETLEMCGPDDWIGIKMTGAGTQVTKALLKNEPIPVEFHEAMNRVCQRAKEKNTRIWIDAEQQAVQKSIDLWTINLMRKWNKDGALVYNTIQAYLKDSRHKLKHQLALASSENWVLGTKLVRGAYIANDQRDKIHDTKADTDASYNGIVKDLLQGTNLGFAEEQFPKMQLFLAGHNPDSVRAAATLVRTLSQQKRLKVLPDFGQLQGMADLLGCELLEHCEGMGRARDDRTTTTAMTTLVVPKVYKCLTWGSVQECIQYLFRRMIENAGASDRMRDGISAYSDELRRRVGRKMFPWANR